MTDENQIPDEINDHLRMYSKEAWRCIMVKNAQYVKLRLMNTDYVPVILWVEISPDSRPVRFVFRYMKLKY